MEFGEHLTAVEEIAIESYLNDGTNVLGSWLYEDKDSGMTTMYFKASSLSDNKESIGRTLLSLCELSFVYLSPLAKAEVDFEEISLLWSNTHFSMITHVTELKSNSEFSVPMPIWEQDGYAWHPFFSDDEDHRYMMGQLFENWRRPNQVVIDLTLPKFDPSYGQEFPISNFRFIETEGDWEKVIPYRVEPKSYFERLKLQGMQS